MITSVEFKTRHCIEKKSDGTATKVPMDNYIYSLEWCVYLLVREILQSCNNLEYEIHIYKLTPVTCHLHIQSLYKQHASMIWQSTFRKKWWNFALPRKAGLILGLRPANERRRYKVTPSLTGWTQTWNQPWKLFVSIALVAIAGVMVQNMDEIHGLNSRKPALQLLFRGLPEGLDK